MCVSLNISSSEKNMSVMASSGMEVRCKRCQGRNKLSRGDYISGCQGSCFQS